jgi:hypothetical protein
MGWSIYIKTNKPVTDAVAKSFVAQLPKMYRGSGEQEWGWSCAVDVQRPSRCHDRYGWYISGAWYSWKIAVPFATRLKRFLEKRGYTVMVDMDQ